MDRSPQEKTYHIMRFKAPHKCELEKLVHVSMFGIRRQRVGRVTGLQQLSMKKII